MKPYSTLGYRMDKGNPRLGRCLCGAQATIRDTKAEDGRLHFICQELTPEGKAKHYGFVDPSEAWRLEGDAAESLPVPEEVEGAQESEELRAWKILLGEKPG